MSDTILYNIVSSAHNNKTYVEYDQLIVDYYKSKIIPGYMYIWGNVFNIIDNRKDEQWINKFIRRVNNFSQIEIRDVLTNLTHTDNILTYIGGPTNLSDIRNITVSGVIYSGILLAAESYYKWEDLSTREAVEAETARLIKEYIDNESMIVDYNILQSLIHLKYRSVIIFSAGTIINKIMGVYNTPDDNTVTFNRSSNFNIFHPIPKELLDYKSDNTKEVVQPNEINSITIKDPELVKMLTSPMFLGKFDRELSDENVVDTTMIETTLGELRNKRLFLSSTVDMSKYNLMNGDILSVTIDKATDDQGTSLNIIEEAEVASTYYMCQDPEGTTSLIFCNEPCINEGEEVDFDDIIGSSFFGGTNQKLVCHNVGDGELRWRLKINPERADCRIPRYCCGDDCSGYEEGTVVDWTAVPDKDLVCYKLSDGSQQWRWTENPEDPDCGIDITSVPIKCNSVVKIDELTSVDDYPCLNLNDEYECTGPRLVPFLVSGQFTGEMESRPDLRFLTYDVYDIESIKLMIENGKEFRWRNPYNLDSEDCEGTCNQITCDSPCSEENKVVDWLEKPGRQLICYDTGDGILRWRDTEYPERKSCEPPEMVSDCICQLDGDIASYNPIDNYSAPDAMEMPEPQLLNYMFLESGDRIPYENIVNFVAYDPYDDDFLFHYPDATAVATGDIISVELLQNYIYRGGTTEEFYFQYPTVTTEFLIEHPDATAVAELDPVDVPYGPEDWARLFPDRLTYDEINDQFIVAPPDATAVATGGEVPFNLTPFDYTGWLMARLPYDPSEFISMFGELESWDPTTMEFTVADPDDTYVDTSNLIPASEVINYVSYDELTSKFIIHYPYTREFIDYCASLGLGAFNLYCPDYVSDFLIEYPDATSVEEVGPIVDVPYGPEDWARLFPDELSYNEVDDEFTVEPVDNTSVAIDGIISINMIQNYIYYSESNDEFLFQYPSLTAEFLIEYPDAVSVAGVPNLLRELPQYPEGIAMLFDDDIVWTSSDNEYRVR